MSYPVLPNNSSAEGQYQPLVDHSAHPVMAPAHAVYVQQQPQVLAPAPYAMQPVMVQPVIMAQPQPRPNAVVVVVGGAQPQPQPHGNPNSVAAAAQSGALATPDMKELPFYGHIADTYRPYAIGVVHKQPISDSWICYQCCPLFLPCMLAAGDLRSALGVLTGQSLCDWICWGAKLKPRAYAAVHENRIEINRPHTVCCGACVRDSIQTHYFDLMPESVQQATCCTPFHALCCIECSGGVISMAPCDCVNNGCFATLCCPCSICCGRTFIGGLSDAKAFESAVQLARAAVTKQHRMVRG